MQFGAQPDAALRWLKPAEQETNKGGFTGTVLPYQPDLVAPEYGHIQVINDPATVRPGKTSTPGLNHQLAGTIRILHRKAGISAPNPALTMLFAHGPERPHPPHIAGSPGLDTLTNPGLFLLQALVEQGVLAFFLFKGLVLELQITVIGCSKTYETAPVQLHDTGSHSPDKCPVMADKQYGTPELPQGFLKPGNGRHIQMVGRLVQQQDIRLGNQCPGQQYPPLPATGKGVDTAVGINTVLGQYGRYLLIQAPAVQRLQPLLNLHQPVQTRFIPLPRQLVEFRQKGSGLWKGSRHHLIGGAGVISRQVLGQYGKHRALFQTDNAIVGHHFTADNLQQGGFTLTIPAQKTYPLASLNNQRCPVQQGLQTKRKGNCVQIQQRHGTFYSVIGTVTESPTRMVPEDS